MRTPLTPGIPDHEDALLEARLARTRARRAKAARIMLLLMVVPLATQGLVVLFGLVAVFGVAVVAVPAAVIWIIRRGR